MKKLLLAVLGLSLGITAQAQELPQPSPAATVMQRVGLTDITVTYSRPSKKERKIFGSLVPYNTLWRTGANRNTMVEFSSNVTFGGKEVEAGTYSLFTIPTEGAWTIILNKNTELWGTDGYSEEEDVARVKMPVKESPMVETFTIGFTNVAANSTDMVIAWDNQMVAVPVKVNSMMLAKANIKKALAETEEDKMWGVYRNAARFYYQNDMSLPEAEKMMAKSIELKSDSWYSYWLQGQILAANGKYKEAVKSGEMSIKLGKKGAKEAGKDFAYAEPITTDIERWKSMK